MGECSRRKRRCTRTVLSSIWRNKFCLIPADVWSFECRNDLGDNHYLKHPKIERRLQTSVGKQQSLCSLQNSVHSPSAQRRMSKQWSMPLSTSVTGAESAAGNSGHTTKDSRTTTLSKSSSCRSAGPSVKRHPGNFAEITIDVADADDDVTMTSGSSRRSVVRNSSVASDRQLLDVYYDTQNR